MRNEHLNTVDVSEVDPMVDRGALGVDYCKWKVRMCLCSHEEGVAVVESAWEAAGKTLPPKWDRRCRAAVETRGCMALTGNAGGWEVGGCTGAEEEGAEGCKQLVGEVVGG